MDVVGEWFVVDEVSNAMMLGIVDDFWNLIRAVSTNKTGETRVVVKEYFKLFCSNIFAEHLLPVVDYLPPVWWDIILSYDVVRSKTEIFCRLWKIKCESLLS